MSSSLSDNKPVLIVGAGMAGLACAVTLHRLGVPFLLFDRDEKVGGRVQTDEIDGYRLDRGFQVLLTAYPEAKRFLDYEKLELKSCYLRRHQPPGTTSRAIAKREPSAPLSGKQPCIAMISRIWLQLYQTPKCVRQFSDIVMDLTAERD